MRVARRLWRSGCRGTRDDDIGEIGMKRIVLGYSGSLAATVAIPWLAETRRAEVVAVTIDFGQGGELEAVRDRALAAGAVRAHVLDVRDAFARDYVAPALRAGALVESTTVAALAAPMIAKSLVEIAAIEQAGIVAHAATSASERRLAAAISTISPVTTIVAPVSEWTMTPTEQVEYGRRHNVLSVEAGANDDRAAARPAAELPDEPAYVDVRIESGVPVGINHIDMPLADLVSTLATIASAHGVADSVAMLQTAHDDLRRLTMAQDVDRVANVVAREYANIIANGRWFSPLRRALDAFVAAAEETVTGNVRLKLFKGLVESVVCEEIRPKSLPLVAVP
jgi:argininosuccinate synthase